MLDERMTLPGLQEIDLEVHEVILAKELERGQRPSDGQDMLAELKKICTHVDRINVDRVAEAERLSQQVMRVAGILVDLGLPPVEHIPQLLRTAQEVLPAVALILKHMQEALDSSAGPWD
jgi:hypothetical protein